MSKFGSFTRFIDATFKNEETAMAFSAKTFSFLSDLANNNSRDWFEANRDRYETDWKEPALDLISSISAQMSALDPPLRADPKLNGSLRRINRDVRFSKDKSPYNPSLHLVFWVGEHPNRSPGVHFLLYPYGIGFGAGQWGIEAGRLKSLRQRIVDQADGAGLFDALDRAASIGCTMGKPDLARLPKGFKADGRQAELLRYKGFVARTHDNLAPKSRITGTAATDWIMNTTHDLLPLIRWLNQPAA